MLFRAAADLVVAVHAAFVVFVLLGGLLVVRWPRLEQLALAPSVANLADIPVDFVCWIE